MYNSINDKISPPPVCQGDTHPCMTKHAISAIARMTNMMTKYPHPLLVKVTDTYLQGYTIDTPLFGKLVLHTAGSFTQTHDQMCTTVLFQFPTIRATIFYSVTTDPAPCCLVNVGNTYVKPFKCSTPVLLSYLTNETLVVRDYPYPQDIYIQTVYPPKSLYNGTCSSEPLGT